MFTFFHSTSAVITIEGEVTHYIIPSKVPPGSMQTKVLLMCCMYAIIRREHIKFCLADISLHAQTVSLSHFCAGSCYQ